MNSDGGSAEVVFECVKGAKVLVDGSLELTLSSGDAEVRERFWFTKPNLRLRSTVESRADGTPGRASFSSEIRRVSRPAS